MAYEKPLTPKQVAEVLGIARSTVLKWCRLFAFERTVGYFYLLNPVQVDMIRNRPDRRTLKWKS